MSKWDHLWNATLTLIAVAVIMSLTIAIAGAEWTLLVLLGAMLCGIVFATIFNNLEKNRLRVMRLVMSSIAAGLCYNIYHAGDAVLVGAMGNALFLLTMWYFYIFLDNQDRETYKKYRSEKDNRCFHFFLSAGVSYLATAFTWGLIALALTPPAKTAALCINAAAFLIAAALVFLKNDREKIWDEAKRRCYQVEAEADDGNAPDDDEEGQDAAGDIDEGDEETENEESVAKSDATPLEQIIALKNGAAAVPGQEQSSRQLGMFDAYQAAIEAIAKYDNLEEAITALTERATQATEDEGYNEGYRYAHRQIMEILEGTDTE